MYLLYVKRKIPIFKPTQKKKPNKKRIEWFFLTRCQEVLITLANVIDILLISHQSDQPITATATKINHQPTQNYTTISIQSAIQMVKFESSVQANSLSKTWFLWRKLKIKCWVKKPNVLNSNHQKWKIRTKNFGGPLITLNTALKWIKTAKYSTRLKWRRSIVTKKK